MKQTKNILEFLQFSAPTADQKSALEKLEAFVSKRNKEDFFILSGAAGTGKTSITTALIGLLNHNGVHYKIAAPTGRAARILGRKARTINSTVHSLIYNAKPNPESGIIHLQPKKNEVMDYTIFIIDEASMISSVASKDDNALFQAKRSLLSDLIDFVKEGNANNKIVFLGDRNQLPPVHERVSQALSEVYLTQKFDLKGSVSILHEVKRQQDGTEILRNATLLSREIEAGGSQFALTGFAKTDIWSAVGEYARSYSSENVDRCISIGATHKMNAVFNGAVRRTLYGFGANTIEQDELLIITRQWKRNGHTLFSGDHLIVKEVFMSDLEEVAGLHFVPVKLKSKTLKGEDEYIEDYLLLESVVQPQGLTSKQENNLRHERYTKNIVYRESGNAFDDRYVGAIRATYGHSITCHKAQGGEWDKVFLNSFYMPSLRYMYTAITRAQNTLVLY
ncbi:ATP-dependent DNA helicase [Robiginitalea biformata]|uniref:Helicase, putative n=1 Tax=Robiginitalea biformata (strain ATCC BAA-864 / DSM 15991 / KCTC 12146 / HTCC2501) TaxID=313596 RepID=A4CI84_ROBBH|nr:AAA family ATPase [Robiginitalea biformata]EAR16642.1 helicase, putative [Robiginitalea biformata HTCC2501]